MVVVSQVESTADLEAVRGLIREFTAYAFTLLDVADRGPVFERLERELADLPGPFALPSGRLLLATVGGEPAGTVGLLGHDETTCQLRRLYVRPTYRGRGLGWQLVQAVIDSAREAGYERIVLNSHLSMSEALAVYEAFGFYRVETGDDFPEALKPYIISMECILVDEG